MTSVPNLLQRLSGNKILLGLLVGASLLGACKPRVQILKPAEVEKPTSPQEDSKKEANESAKKREFNVALLLPFQLDHIAPQALGVEDVQRSALALDFYQGFQMGLETIISAQSLFQVHVLDSRDDAQFVRQLAQSPEIQSAQLIVGPIYPKEILAFGQATAARRPLFVSPLAASLPSEFNFPNLVTITAPITVHARSLAKRISQQFRSGDQVVLFNSKDASSRQFLPQVRAAIQQFNADIPVIEVDDEQTLIERSRRLGKNLVVVGTSNAYELTPLFATFLQMKNQEGFDVRVFGHPNWAKLSFDASQQLELFQTSITSSYTLSGNQSETRQFLQQYQQKFKIPASEYAVKGYDAGRYFGRLMEKYGADFAAHLVKEPFQGIHNTFIWEQHSRWGFVNQSAPVVMYRNGAFVPAQD
jgi:ABC-type branched-subunit amino acid transport system substrate-binding protein